MDGYERILYRAFDVSDLLSDENQLRACSFALLQAAEIEIDAVTVNPWQRCAQAYVESAAKMLGDHRMDAAIGGYASDFPVDTGASGATAELISMAHDRAAELAGSAPPAEGARALASTLVETIVTCAHSNPDALRDLSR